ncbi:Myb/SANT-like domain [Macleaya cordata]|uniref:Myb/SANT-like domain n=1 Tax=Macleaya cordata TaxID=56857 RepID=A0A200RCI9_MACCD|nr:Myb/SANT-like domain [Macleaya cordata]
MDRAMFSTFREQALIGNKAKGGQAGWKAPAFIVVAKIVQPLCHQTLTKDHVHNRLKTMRRMMKNVQEILQVSGFGWSNEKKIVRPH